MISDGYVSSNYNYDPKKAELLDKLEIPNDGVSVSVRVLYDILLDESKIDEIVRKLKMKAFW